jgi:ribulose-phosphate 3-epimerase
MERQKVRKLLLLVSFLLFPVTLFYLSPVLIITGGFSGIVTGCFLVFAALFVSSLVFGRAFCGWICPAGGLQECCCSQIVDNNVKSRKVDRIKYIIWAPWLITIILAFIMAGGIKGVDLFYMTNHGISVSDLTGLIIYLFFVALITVLALAIGRRGMCHSICWMAPFMIIGTKIKDRLGYPSLHLEADSEENNFKAIELIKSLGVKVGLSLKPKTPLEALLPYINLLDLVLVMSVEPGFGGQSFMHDQLSKMSVLRKLIDERGLSCEIEVDGGINSETAKLCINAGVDVLVSGNTIFKASDRAAAIKELRGN